MFCINCGTELPDAANYCWNCGKAQREGVTPEEPKWETCEIVHEEVSSIFGFKYKLWAEAIGPQGSYCAGESPVFHSFDLGYSPPGSPTSAADACRALIKRLVEDGWEPTGDRGSHWWNSRFRRRLK